MATSDKKEFVAQISANDIIKPASVKTPAQVVYIGPNMGGDLPMTQFTIYRGGLPMPMQTRADNDPEFSRLFVPVEDLAAARAELKDKTSVRGMAFAAVVKSKGGK